MEDSKTFVNETDYKSLWEYTNKKCNEAEELASARLDQIEDLERELAEARREVADVRGHVDVLEGRIDNLLGQVDAYKYAIRYYMAGDPA
jgi:phage shock protein A